MSADQKKTTATIKQKPNKSKHQTKDVNLLIESIKPIVNQKLKQP